MNKINEITYWITLAHMPKWGHKKINELIIKIFHDNQISIIEFFNLLENDWRNIYELDEIQISDLKLAKSELVNNAFLAESLLNQGFEVIPITSPEYSKTLKANLKVTYSPPVLYIKGNKQIMQRKSIAIVGSRASSDIALTFTDNITKNAIKNHKVVVSGFAKGVDKQALNSAIKHKGQSIIVLPQGIMTFTSGFKNYYKQIIDGDVLVLSTFHPKSKWSVGLAMARNPIIYGLANEIYVAESSEKGGTWSGVIDGLRKKRKIYVRRPEINEKNANNILIQKGAKPVNFNGNELNKTYDSTFSESVSIVQEPKIEPDNLNNKIRSIINDRSLTTKEILAILNLNWSSQKLIRHLKNLDFIETKKYKGKNIYTLKESDKKKQPTLFNWQK